MNEAENARTTGLGAFAQRGSGACRGRDPQTGEEIGIEASRYAAFRPVEGSKDPVGRT